MSVYVVALHAEARPLIDALRLKRRIDKPWPYYNNGEQHLLVSGMGALNAAAACGWLIGRQPALDQEPWLNVGTAGHASHSLGETFWIERLLEPKGSVYPALHVKNNLPGESLLSVEAPCEQYPANSLVDMEGLGFYSTCSRFVPLELLQLIKVVSDNSANPLAQVDATKTSALISNSVEQVLAFAESLKQLAACLPEPVSDAVESCSVEYHTRMRFSHSQLLQLHKLLSRYHVLTDSLCGPADLPSAPRDAKQALAMLEAQIAALPVVMQ